MRLPTMLLCAIGFTLTACASVAQEHKMPSKITTELGQPTGKTEKLYFAAGCFWCIESQMDMLKGVSTAVSGYAGGKTKNPTYKDVMSGTTGHAEVVEVTFDPGVIKAEDILRIFFVSHDPTQLNRQGPDVGTQYRSATFYRNDEEKALLEKIKAEMIAEKLFLGKIVTTIEPLGTFTRAEEYHQNYYAKFEKASEAEKAQMNAGYCSYVVSPKIIKFREQFAHLLKN